MYPVENTERTSIFDPQPDKQDVLKFNVFELIENKWTNFEQFSFFWKKRLYITWFAAKNTKSLFAYPIQSESNMRKSQEISLDVAGIEKFEYVRPVRRKRWKKEFASELRISS